MKIMRVFPRRTVATPDDDLVRFSSPDLFDHAIDVNEVHISVSFTWDIEKAERLYKDWSHFAPIKIGGPAMNDHGGEFTPGLYIKHGYTITSRGCVHNCWFCSVPKREGAIRELKIHPGYNVLDSNLLACSETHIRAVFEMLSKQSERPRFTGGLEAARITPWIATELKKLNPKTAYFAYDSDRDYEPLVEGWRIMREAGITNSNRAYSCYVLVGFRGDTFERAEKRLRNVIALGLMPMAMLYNRGEDRSDSAEWIKFQRSWANRTIVGKKYSDEIRIRRN